jgi:hypothetical protein
MNSTLETIIKTSKAEQNSSSYKNYLEVRKSVCSMLDRMQDKAAPSSYWQEEISGFSYMFDASPLIISKLRHQCYHITGLKVYDYRTSQLKKRAQLEKKLLMLNQHGFEELLVPESQKLGGFGYNINGGLINIDTLKFYEVFIALKKAGLIDRFRDQSERISIIEIGAGWGGFAYQFKTLFPEVNYIIIDLPQTMLFSGTYLKTVFPNSKMIMIENKVPPRLQDYDFVFIPHFLQNNLTLTNFNAVINMVSFQEMTSSQVEEYVQMAVRLKSDFLYSLNRDRSHHNNELSTVSSILKKFGKVEEIRILDLQYTQFKKKGRNLRTKAKEFIRQSLLKQKTKPHNAYRHYFLNMK